MHKPQAQVQQFHREVSHQPTSPAEPDLRMAELRAKLILEEAIETVQALLGSRRALDLIDGERADLLHRLDDGRELPGIEHTKPDLIETIDGICDILYVTYGTAEAIGVDIEPFFDEVHRSNMAKRGGETRADGKLIKPKDWTPPDITKVLAKVKSGEQALDKTIALADKVIGMGERLLDAEAQLADLRQRLTDAEAKFEIAAKLALTPTRQKLPDERKAITHKMKIDKTEGYITVGEYDNGRPGELFLTIDHAGTKLRGMTYAVSILTSLLFQYGVPLSVIAEKFIGSHFEPEGRTKHPDIRYALSILDYAYRWLLIRYEPETYFARFPKVKAEPEAAMPAEVSVGWNWNVEAKP